MPKVKRMQDAFLAESDDLTNGMSRFCFKLSKKLKSYWGKHVLKAPPSKRICKVNTIILRRNYLSRESFVAKFVSSFFPSNPVGPASQLALQVCLHVWKQDEVSIIFRFSRPLTQTTMVFWASKSLFLASMSRQMAPGIIENIFMTNCIHTFKHFQRGAVEMDVQAVWCKWGWGFGAAGG